MYDCAKLVLQRVEQQFECLFVVSNHTVRGSKDGQPVCEEGRFDIHAVWIEGKWDDKRIARGHVD